MKYIRTVYHDYHILVQMSYIKYLSDAMAMYLIALLVVGTHVSKERCATKAESFIVLHTKSCMAVEK